MSRSIRELLHEADEAEAAADALDAKLEAIQSQRLVTREANQGLIYKTKTDGLVDPQVAPEPNLDPPMTVADVLADELATFAHGVEKVLHQKVNDAIKRMEQRVESRLDAVERKFDARARARR